MDLGSGFASAGFLALLPFARRLSGIAVKEVIHGAASENKNVTDAHGSYFKSRFRDNLAHILGDITRAQTLTASASLKPIKSSCTALIHYSPRAEDTLKPKGSNHFKGFRGFHSVQIDSDKCKPLCGRYFGIGTGQVFDKAAVLGVFEGHAPLSFNSLVSVIDSASVAAQEVGSGNVFSPAQRRRLDRVATSENDLQDAEAQFEKATKAHLVRQACILLY
jgi:hypothetical protein